MIRIGITGHQRVGDESTTTWVRAALNQVLSRQAEELVGVSNLAVGADQMFAELVLERGGALEAVLPFPEYRERFAEGAAVRYDRLLARARADVLARDGRSDQEAYMHGGEEVVARSDRLVAVWDGAAAAGLGGTADIVAVARRHARSLVVVDPIRRQVWTENGDSRGVLEPSVPSTLDVRALDAERRIGDPILDPIVSEQAAARGSDAIRAAMAALFGRRTLPQGDPIVDACLAALGDLDLGDADRIARGQKLFSLLGPEIFLVLGSCSLPLAFAAGNGVQAIYRSRRMNDEPVRRLYDTAQMIINVMQVGGLAPGAIGWRAARKVRLIHALVRHFVQSNPIAPWSPVWGTPINQEDLAGTLLSFSVAVLHGLRRMGAKLSADEAEGYVYAWSRIGRMLGVDEALLAETEHEAANLAAHIGARQIRATPEGKDLAEQLMGAVATLFPLRGYANSLTHFFLEDTAFGAHVAETLQLPKPGWTRSLVAARAWQKRATLALLNVVPGAHRRRSYLARRFVQSMILRKRPEPGGPFEIPEELTRIWRLSLGPTHEGEPRLSA